MLKQLSNFIKLESFGGIVLFFATIIALIISNSSFSAGYESFFNSHLTISFSNNGLSKPLLLWINEGLMAVFFCLVVLELKQEFYGTKNESNSRFILPAIAAVGGMLAPAIIYYLIVKSSQPDAIVGWAIPTATDLAFSLGVLSLFGKRVPFQLKVMLTAIAIFDDLASIIIIAIYYTEQIYWQMLFAASILCFVLFTLNNLRIKFLFIYVLVGLGLWFFVLKSGVHATLAGVILALAIPIDKDNKFCLVKKLMHKLHPWVSYFVIPLFALANAGINLTQVDFNVFNNSISLGIFLGLFLGKPIGIVSFIWLAEFFNIAFKPKGISWMAIFALSLLCGIGFTMSLFLGTLAFDNYLLYGVVKVGVFFGSVTSGILAAIILYYAKLKC